MDEETLADARNELDKLKSQRRQLDEQIATATASAQTSKVAAEVRADEMLGKIEIFLATLATMPKPVRDWLNVLMPTVVVDVEIKAIEIHVILPSEMLNDAVSSVKPMRLVSTSASPVSYETQQAITTRPIAIFDREFQKVSNLICYLYQRHVA